MTKRFSLNNLDYAVDDLSEQGQAALDHLLVAIKVEEDLKAQIALLTRARNGYIEDIKLEVVEKKSGVDIQSLLRDD
tara:strand:- start:307 stop:537 length:231 start_codon:yes stop_codon:yes gene_type:complete